jgi:O-antigen/teichoic acid export membrane protein
MILKAEPLLLKDRLRPWLGKLTYLFIGQGLMQAISFVGSFALLRWMNVESYALFTLAWGLQSILMTIGDLGVCGAIIPSVGSRVHNPLVVGRVIEAARRIRLALFPLVFISGLVGIWIVHRNHEISMREQIMLFGCMMFAVWSNASALLHTIPLVLTQRLSRLQLQQNTGAVLRLSLYGTSHVFGFFAAPMPLLVNCVVQAVGIAQLAHWSKGMVVKPHRNDGNVKVEQKQILLLILPQLPLLIFNSVQSQLAIFIASIYGGTMALAEVGALTRFNALFAFIVIFYPWIVVPYFSKIDRRIVGRRAAQWIGFALIGLTALFFLVSWFPAPFLWILGSKYGHLGREMPFALLGVALGQVPGLIGTIIFSRRALVAESVLFIAIPVLACQFLGAWIIAPNTTLGAVLLIMWANIGSLLGHVVLLLRYLTTNKTVV